ncbi:diadenylate cyclase [Rhabdothermincola salaria]|uniref:diadenylate cyclase n=1 Tax=Rhabdothermincola salaria TaxID=2903142 RepID=UPI001E486B1D|nr:diadenylate cyclase [Rhabdothermincola salaria]
MTAADIDTSQPHVEPPDPVGEAVTRVLAGVMFGASVGLSHQHPGEDSHTGLEGPGSVSATASGPDGWETTCTVCLDERIAGLLQEGSEPLMEMLGGLPAAGLRAAERFRGTAVDPVTGRLDPAVRRALRDVVAAEVLADYVPSSADQAHKAALVGEVIEYLVELSSTRVESHDLTHGVLIADVLEEDPRLLFDYPADVRAAKRAPLLFDGQRSVLVVDGHGHARTELQWHRIDRLATDDVTLEPALSPAGRRMASPRRSVALVESGSLVAAASRRLGGLGFFLRADRSIWTFLSGRPFLVRRGEHWSAFPLQLAALVERMIGGGEAAGIVVDAAFIVSGDRGGAILAIVDDASAIDGTVPLKDRYDLRDDVDPLAMRPETKLHHLIDAKDIDDVTLARLALLDGATIVDRDGRLLAYGAIVDSADSEHEGARTAAAKSLSKTAMVVLKVSADGDITVFRDGRVVATLLGPPPL